jgi:hypothetical protein
MFPLLPGLPVDDGFLWDFRNRLLWLLGIQWIGLLPFYPGDSQARARNPYHSRRMDLGYYKERGIYLFFLMDFSSGSGLTIWETLSWKLSRLVTGSECSSLAWLPNSRIFFFSLQGSLKVHMLQMKECAPNLG